jgi:hypothetical protein
MRGGNSSYTSWALSNASNWCLVSKPSSRHKSGLIEFFASPDSRVPGEGVRCRMRPCGSRDRRESGWLGPGSFTLPHPRNPVNQSKRDNYIRRMLCAPNGPSSNDCCGYCPRPPFFAVLVELPHGAGPGCWARRSGVPAMKIWGGALRNKPTFAAVTAEGSILRRSWLCGHC